MLKVELFDEINGVKYYRTYSEDGYNIRQIETNEIYQDAIDIESNLHKYEETDEKIEEEQEEVTE